MPITETHSQFLTNYYILGRNYGEQAAAVINHLDKWDSNPVVASALPDADATETTGCFREYKAQ